MKLRTCYRTLGLSPGASLEAIKRAYRKMAHQWHPDRFPEDRVQQEAAAERFRSIHAAYRRLCEASEKERAALRTPDEMPVSARRTRATSRPPVARYGVHGREGSTYPSKKVAAHGARRSVDGSAVRIRRGSVGDGAGQVAHSTRHSPDGPSATSDGPAVWGAIAFVAGGVGVFCLGLLYSTTLAGMLAWAATWAVFAVGAFARLRPVRS